MGGDGLGTNLKVGAPTKRASMALSPLCAEGESWRPSKGAALGRSGVDLVHGRFAWPPGKWLSGERRRRPGERRPGHHHRHRVSRRRSGPARRCACLRPGGVWVAVPRVAHIMKGPFTAGVRGTVEPRGWERPRDLRSAPACLIVLTRSSPWSRQGHGHIGAVSRGWPRTVGLHGPPPAGARLPRSGGIIASRAAFLTRDQCGSGGNLQHRIPARSSSIRAGAAG